MKSLIRSGKNNMKGLKYHLSSYLSPYVMVELTNAWNKSTNPQLPLYSNFPWLSCIAKSGVWKFNDTIWQPAFQNIWTEKQASRLCHLMQSSSMILISILFATYCILIFQINTKSKYMINIPFTFYHIKMIQNYMY